MQRRWAVSSRRRRPTQSSRRSKCGSTPPSSSSRLPKPWTSPKVSGRGSRHFRRGTHHRGTRRHETAPAPMPVAPAAEAAMPEMAAPPKAAIEAAVIGPIPIAPIIGVGIRRAIAIAVSVAGAIDRRVAAGARRSRSARHGSPGLGRARRRTIRRRRAGRSRRARHRVIGIRLIRRHGTGREGKRRGQGRRLGATPERGRYPRREGPGEAAGRFILRFVMTFTSTSRSDRLAHSARPDRRRPGRGGIDLPGRWGGEWPGKSIHGATIPAPSRYPWFSVQRRASPGAAPVGRCEGPIQVAGTAPAFIAYGDGNTAANTAKYKVCLTSGRRARQPLARLVPVKILPQAPFVSGTGVPPALPAQVGNHPSRDRLCRLVAGRRARTPAPLKNRAFACLHKHLSGEGSYSPASWKGQRAFPDRLLQRIERLALHVIVEHAEDRIVERS